MLDILFRESMAVINKTWPFFHAGFPYDFPTTALAKEKKAPSSGWGVGWGDSERVEGWNLNEGI